MRTKFKFFLANNLNYEIHNFCIVCGAQRFENDEINILTNKNITINELLKSFQKKNKLCIDPYLCNNIKCKYYLIYNQTKTWEKYEILLNDNSDKITLEKYLFMIFSPQKD